MLRPPRSTGAPAVAQRRLRGTPRPPAASADPPGADMVLQERGVTFTPGNAFYRVESAQARDLAVLAAAVHRRRTGGPLRVLDLMSGCGVRGARYVQQAGADLVHCNDYNPSNRPALVRNLLAGLEGVEPGAGPSSPPAWRQAGLRSETCAWWGRGADGRAVEVRASHVDARRLLASLFLEEELFDLVDVDSFGSETSHLGAALDVVRFGGLVYLTSTDGFCSGGKRPEASLAAYGAYLRALPSANEQGLRMLIGAAQQRAAPRGLVLEPLFSLYSYHGPVFRTMLRVTRSHAWPAQQMGFLGHCFAHGETRRVGWSRTSHAWCRCDPCLGSSQPQQQQQQQQQQGEGEGGSVRPEARARRPLPLVLSGPMWTGPLHSAAFVGEMAAEAAARGWRGPAWDPKGSARLTRRSPNNPQRSLEELLELLLEEADPALPPWYVPVESLAAHLDATPQRDALVAALRARGHAAARCHIENRAVRSSASVAQMVAVAVEDLGRRRRTQPAATRCAEAARAAAAVSSSEQQEEAAESLAAALSGSSGGGAAAPAA